VGVDAVLRCPRSGWGDRPADCPGPWPAWDRASRGAAGGRGRSDPCRDRAPAGRAVPEAGRADPDRAPEPGSPGATGRRSGRATRV